MPSRPDLHAPGYPGQCPRLARAVAGLWRRPLLALLLCGGAWLLCPAGLQAQNETPIKIHGGAATFFSEKNWVPFQSQRQKGYCAALTPDDLRLIQLKGFYAPEIQIFRSRPSQDRTLTPKTQNWRIDIVGHAAKESTTVRPGTEGITLQVAPTDCQGGQTSASVRLLPLGGGRFYPPSMDLLPAGLYTSNKRFLSTCKDLDRDRCERIAEIRFFDTDPHKAEVFRCPDGACTIQIGQPRRQIAPR